jgi:hypothetical protein
LFAGPCPILKANTPIWWSGPCGPGVGVSPPQIEIYQANPSRGATFACWPPPNSHCKYPHLVEGTLRAWCWGEPPQIKFYLANLPRGATFVCWPPPFSHCKYPHLVEWTLRARGWGVLPKNKILLGKPTLRSNWPPPNS